MAFATCVVSGTVTNTAGTGIEGAMVRVRIGAQSPTTNTVQTTPLSWTRSWDGAVFGTEAVSAVAQTVWTTAGGAFSVTLPQSAAVLFEIPSADVYHVGCVPTASTATFASMFATMQKWIR